MFLNVSFIAYPQDTIRIMQYNLMYYGQTTTYCTVANNPMATKDVSLKKIVRYVKPDIFTANEIAPNTSTHQHILDNILNINGITHFRKGSITNLSGSDLSNGMFYNSDKLALLSQKNIMTSVRDINIYNFYYKANNLASTNDTAYLTCIVMHLKAGSYPADETERAVQTNKLMTYLNSLNKKANYLLMGDFNVYSSDEACFQNIINHSNANIRFYDPVNMVGSWSGNYVYCDVHSQSTHSSSSGCFSTGGLDDRFDFILQSEYIKNGTQHFQYLSGSYKTIGQDGNHFNDAVTDGINNSAPDSIIDALYQMSDHLPVVMNLKVNQTVGSDELQAGNIDVFFPNPVTDYLRLSLMTRTVSTLEFSIINLLGQKVFAASYESDGSFFNYQIPVGSFTQGIYFLTVTDGKSKPVTKKFLIK
ncbi:MAG TPA: T9SS type A sorting domain-containing protein [Bacteroidales bacterium]|nr:T9SS type A sorting domain-containing protein [Bacteroidales bacterium]